MNTVEYTVMPKTPKTGDLFLESESGTLYILAIVESAYVAINLSTGVSWCGMQETIEGAVKALKSPTGGSNELEHLGEMKLIAHKK